MRLYAFEPVGFDGELVTVEVDLRRGIPSVDIVGLPDGAIKEARERIRAAVRNSGFEFPLERLLINLAPAGLKKGGSSFDLSMALAILAASSQIPENARRILALGELELSGTVRAVSGVLPAVAAGLQAGIDAFIVAPGNLREALVLAPGKVWPLPTLAVSVNLFAALRSPADASAFISEVQNLMSENSGAVNSGTGGLHAGRATQNSSIPDFRDLRGQDKLRRAMEIAAAGGHHVLLFGPPGAGKTMAARRLPGILPDLDDAASIETTKIHSLAGLLPELSGLIRTAPFRTPHHGASTEGIVGGGKSLRPGEVSLAHGGVLFLDEAPEFRTDVLQALREPLEEGRISIARADRTVTYPSRFTLVLACNPCPCGNLGRETAVCLCSAEEIRRYWKRLGGPLLDRIDIRVPVKPCSAEQLSSDAAEESVDILRRVTAARHIQHARNVSGGFRLNGHLNAQEVESVCLLAGNARKAFFKEAEKSGFSSRACHSVLRVARTVADLAGNEIIDPANIEEAISLRKYGDDDWFWQIP